MKISKFGVYLKSLTLVSILGVSGCGDGNLSVEGEKRNGTLSGSDVAVLSPVNETRLPSGSGIGSGTAPKTQADVSDAEYSQNAVFNKVRAYKALQWDITGAGVKIAVLDSGIDSDHVDLMSNLDTANSGNAIDLVTTGSGYEDAGQHGTRVSGVALANNNGSGVQGVAPDAQLIAIKVTDGASLNEDNQIRGMDMARNAGADIINISFGLDGFETNNLQDAVDNEAITLDLINAYKRGINDNIVYTLAAGNSGKSNPEWDGKVAAYGASGGQMLVVGSLNAAGDDIANFSNRAGDAKNYFILAPGEALTLTDSDGGYVTGSGTSFAAPFVAGAAALVKSAGPPTLSGKEVVEILLSTTDDLGAPGNDEIYGAGRLNIERALSPIGSPTVSTVSSTNGKRVPLSSLGFSSSGLIQASLGRASDLKNVLFFDSFKRAYTADLSVIVDQLTEEKSVNWLETKTHTNHLALGESTKLAIAYTQETEGSAADIDQARLSLITKLSESAQLTVNVGNNWNSNFTQTSQAKQLDKSFLTLTNQGVGGKLVSSLNDKTKLKLQAGLGKNSETAFKGQQALALAGIDHKLNDKTLLSFDVGVSREENQIMGTELGVGLQPESGIETRFVTLGLEHQIMPNLNIGMDYSFGQSGNAVGQGLMKNFTGGDLDSAKIWLGYEGENQKFQASLNRELGYRSGSLLLSIPQSVTYEGDAGTVHFNNQNIALKNATVYGASVSYERGLGKFGSLELMSKLKLSHTSTGSTGFDDSSVDAGIKYKLAF